MFKIDTMLKMMLYVSKRSAALFKLSLAFIFLLKLLGGQIYNVLICSKHQKSSIIFYAT